ncbi:MAG: Gfo/Idh/MocA family oxidoreductase [Pseudomonadales bacterium]|jgi:predicted dehydrogenase|nr:Gfo/Idh/MocA family oxidoreductase [Pseudomonadales bacterium]MDP6470639.1 Gfo/Idh/MocA family oxidoreductase [Pseudomonadales bacterium]MDP6828505.1 Gfo/Idh/MocA family oxidoreductase [Pseudomonadales bacterium]MDP6970510.1 Gfo/Idh/MocA family oxidoreductase [Pseudomonadales bacterium]|tara:strand:- start:1242 stop:2426 length:1185 start_codon:yes stop_codon:yes gene_type:complete
MSINRRAILKAGGAAVLAPFANTHAAPSDTINIGVIGCNGMGFSDLASMVKVPGTRAVALCDVDVNVLERRAADVVSAGGNAPRLYGDYRALLDDRDIDAVIIGTPDHWHCLQMVHAAEAGKDVYVEKPLANSIDECTRMIVAAERYATVVQVGQWQRSGAHWCDAMDYVHSGSLGEIRAVRAWAYMDWLKNIPRKPDTSVPEGVDYDMWLGPAPERPFNPNRFHFTFRWFWDYAGGLMTDWGVHLIDIVVWGMKADFPRRVMSSGGNFAYPESAMETPDTQQAIYEFDGFSMIWEHAVGIGLGPFQRSHGIAFIGNNGTLVVDRAGWELFPESEPGRDGARHYKLQAVPRRTARPEARGLDQHTENFIECMRTRATPRCDLQTASLAAVCPPR